jgi:choline monooxygenase
MPDRLQQEIMRFSAEATIDSARTPPASWYTMPSFHALEKRAVFQQQWQIVGRTATLQSAGDYFTGNFMGWPYIVALDEEKRLVAFYNVCAHHGTCVAEGEGNCEQFVCPYHGWTYGLTGKLKRAPHAGALAGLRDKGLNLQPIHVESWGPFIALHFGKPAVKLRQWVKPLMATFSRDPFAGMQFVRSVTYEVPCNWKVYIDNYLDGGYHVPHMHPGLADQLALDSYRTILGDQWSVQVCRGQEEPGQDSRGDFAERVGSQADYAWLYPNFMINRYGPWLDTIRAIPLDADRCLTIMDYYHEGPVGAGFANDSIAASHTVQLEDILICERVQTGLKSGVYQQGIYAPRFEAPMLRFHQILAKDFLRSKPNA